MVKDAKTNVNDDIGRIGRISYYANLLHVMAREIGNPNFLPGRSDCMIKNQWRALKYLRHKNINAGVSSSSAHNPRVSVDSANNGSGSTITLFGKSFAINEDTNLPCMNKPPSPLVDSANNSSGSTITLFGKSFAINEDTSLPCMNKPPSPSGVTVAYHGDCIAGTSTVMPSTVVALPAQPKFIDFLGVGDH
nr:hypothetical protein [Tanacetum cinerariifolium]